MHDAKSSESIEAVSQGDRFLAFVMDWAKTFSQINKRDYGELLHSIAEKNPCFAKRAQIKTSLEREQQ